MNTLLPIFFLLVLKTRLSSSDTDITKETDTFSQQDVPSRHSKQYHHVTEDASEIHPDYNDTYTEGHFKAFTTRVLSENEKPDLHVNHQWSILNLGSPLEPFKGPRRRRDSPSSYSPTAYDVFANSLETMHLTPKRTPFEDQSFYRSQYQIPDKSSDWNKVVYQQLSHMLSPSNAGTQFQRRGATLSVEEFKYRQHALQNALRSAWDQYGPKTHGPAIDPVTYSDQLYPTAKSEEQYPGYGSMNHGNFQDMKSEWDSEVTLKPDPTRVILKPGLFSRFLSSYIDFEVNNHEVADTVRKILFGVLVALIALGWVGLGLFLGVIPFKLLLGKGIKMPSGKIFAFPDNANELTERIMLSLDSDWLKQLENKVFKSTKSNWIKTHVRCCVLPEEEANGVADCTLVRKGKKMGTFDCLTDLIYNFEFSSEQKENELRNNY